MTEDQQNNQPYTSVVTWLADTAAQRQELEANALANKTAIFDALAAANITRVDVNFDGSGDSGQIENMTAMAGETLCDLPPTQVPLAGQRWHHANSTVSAAPLSEAIETLVYDLLEITHYGWEINDGAYGDFIFDVAERTIRLEYNERIESSEYSEHHF